MAKQEKLKSPEVGSEETQETKRMSKELKKMGKEVEGGESQQEQEAAPQEKTEETRGERKERGKKEKGKVSPKNLEGEMGTKQKEIAKLTEYVEGTKVELNKEEEPPSISFDKKRIEKLEKEVEALRAEGKKTERPIRSQGDVDLMRAEHRARREMERKPWEDELSQQMRERKEEEEGKNKKTAAEAVEDAKAGNAAKVGETVYYKGELWNVTDAHDNDFNVKLMRAGGGTGAEVTRGDVLRVTPENKDKIEKIIKRYSEVAAGKKIGMHIPSQLEKSEKDLLEDVA